MFNINRILKVKQPLLTKVFISVSFYVCNFYKIFVAESSNGSFRI